MTNDHGFTLISGSVGGHWERVGASGSSPDMVIAYKYQGALSGQ